MYAKGSIYWIIQDLFLAHVIALQICCCIVLTGFLFYSQLYEGALDL